MNWPGNCASRMGLSSTFTLYQAQTGSVLNASLAYFPGEAHVILAGPLTEVLSPQELRAVLAHELAHFLLFDGWHGDYFAAAELLRAISADASAGRPTSRAPGFTACGPKFTPIAGRAMFATM